MGESEQLNAARAGDPDALAALVERHRAAGFKRAKRLVGRQDADDLLNEAMTRVLHALSAGNGPREAFRPYLLRTISNVHIDWLRRPIREYPADDVYDGVPMPATDDVAVTAVDQDVIRRSFAALPVRWRRVLWLTAVEGKSTAEVARLLEITPNAVAALAFRAREGLRGLYLAQHLESVDSDACRWVGERLPRLLRSEWHSEHADLVRRHLKECGDCRRTAATLGAINSRLGALLGPAVLLVSSQTSRRVRSESARAANVTAGVVTTLGAILVPLALLSGAATVDSRAEGSREESLISDSSEARAAIAGTLPVVEVRRFLQRDHPLGMGGGSGVLSAAIVATAVGVPAQPTTTAVDDRSGPQPKPRHGRSRHGDRRDPHSPAQTSSPGSGHEGHEGHDGHDHDGHDRDGHGHDGHHGHGHGHDGWGHGHGHR